MKKFLCAAAYGALMAVSASAAIVVDLLPGSPTPSGANYQYTYDIDLSTNSSIEAGDFFVFYDVVGFVSASSTSGLFTPTMQATGPNPSVSVGPSPGADTSIINVKFTFNGPTITNTSGTLSNDLGDLVIISSTNQIRIGEGGQRSGALTGGANLSAGIQSVEIPGQVVPEPATMSLMGGALLGLGFFARRRK